MFLQANIIETIIAIYVALLVVKILPLLLIGKASRNKLIVDPNNIKLCMEISFKSLKYLKMKYMNKNPIKIITKIPKIPVSVKISK